MKITHCTKDRLYGLYDEVRGILSRETNRVEAANFLMGLIAEEFSYNEIDWVHKGDLKLQFGKIRGILTDLEERKRQLTGAGKLTPGPAVILFEF